MSSVRLSAGRPLSQPAIAHNIAASAPASAPVNTTDLANPTAMPPNGAPATVGGSSPTLRGYTLEEFEADPSIERTGQGRMDWSADSRAFLIYHRLISQYPYERIAKILGRSPVACRLTFFKDKNRKAQAPNPATSNRETSHMPARRPRSKVQSPSTRRRNQERDTIHAATKPSSPAGVSNHWASPSASNIPHDLQSRPRSQQDTRDSHATMFAYGQHAGINYGYANDGLAPQYANDGLAPQYANDSLAPQYANDGLAPYSAGHSYSQNSEVTTTQDTETARALLSLSATTRSMSDSINMTCTCHQSDPNVNHHGSVSRCQKYRQATLQR